MLTRRKLLFIDNYIHTLNATKSAELSGYSKRTAKSQGSRLLTDVDVKQRIEEGIEKVCAESKITKENAIKKLWDIAQSTETKENDRIRAIEVLSKIKKWHKDSDGNKIAIFQEIQKALTDGEGDRVSVSKSE